MCGLKTTVKDVDIIVAARNCCRSSLENRDSICWLAIENQRHDLRAKILSPEGPDPVKGLGREATGWALQPTWNRWVA